MEKLSWCLSTEYLLVTSARGTGRYSVSYWRRQVNTCPAAVSAINNGDLPAKITWYDRGPNAVVVIVNHTLVVIKVYSLRYNPCLTLFQ